MAPGGELNCHEDASVTPDAAASPSPPGVQLLLWVQRVQPRIDRRVASPTSGGMPPLSVRSYRAGIWAGCHHRYNWPVGQLAEMATGDIIGCPPLATLKVASLPDLLGSTRAYKRPAPCLPRQLIPHANP